MTKKKPDFLRDLDTAIMDELTGGGIKENAAGLVGTLTELVPAAKRKTSRLAALREE